MKLTKKIEAEVDSYIALGIKPQIRVVGYSHGGNVVLNLGAVRQKEKNVKKNVQKTPLLDHVKNETKQAIFAITFLALSVIFLLASISTGTPGHEIYYAGPVGNEIFNLLWILIGVGYFLIPVFFLMLSISFFKAEEKQFNKLKVFGGCLFFISGLGLIDLFARTYEWKYQGGKIGWCISTPLLNMFGFYSSTIILIAILIISCLVLFETKLTIDSILFWRKNIDEEDAEDEEEEEVKVTIPKEEKQFKSHEAPSFRSRFPALLILSSLTGCS